MSLFEELIEDKELDQKIVKSFKIKDNLSKDVFEMKDDEYLMHNDVRNKLLKITDNFMDFLGVEFFIHDIVLTGSLSNFNWSEFSDVDLHILIDFEDTKYNTKLLKEFFDSKKGLWNEQHNIKIKGYDVELYVQDINEPHVSSGVYSILNNKWDVKPEKNTSNIDDRKIIEKGEEYANLIDDVIRNSKKNDVSNKIDSIKNKIKKFRQCGLESGGEYSYENLTFKLLRRNGYMKKLLDLKTKTTDKKLSITQQ
jgi:predicted nucleotidyltransferase